MDLILNIELKYSSTYKGILRQINKPVTPAEAHVIILTQQNHVDMFALRISPLIIKLTSNWNQYS